MALTTSYSLPFEVLCEPGALMAGNQDVRLQIGLMQDVDAATADAFDAIATPFVLLASSGALSGESIPPWESTIQDDEDITANRREVDWLLRGCNLDEKAIPVLAQMLLMAHSSHKIQKIVFSRTLNAQKFQRLASDSRCDPYPGIWGKIPFRINIEAEVPSDFNLRLVFSKSLSDEEFESASVELDGWATGVMTGAYGVAPVPPERCAAFPDEEATSTDNVLEWEISRFRAHPSALNGLVNVSAAISHKVARIVELAIE